tara:strand:- start:8253 stop:8933 length:681 start_codon:yes stop_codon:yes gene_type:complete
MELIKEHKNNNNKYTKKIRITKYTEGENISIEKEGAKDICEIIISFNDHEYNTIQKQQRENYIVNKKLKIADNVTKDERFNRLFHPKLIQNGLQSKNHLSSILYMNELYKIHIVIYNEKDNKFYKTSFMDYPMIFCGYRNNSWHHLEDITVTENTIYHPISELPDIIVQDTNIMIFKSELKPLSKYKVKELEEMCIKNDIQIKNGDKKKLKKELYDDLSLYYIQSS